MAVDKNGIRPVSMETGKIKTCIGAGFWSEDYLAMIHASNLDQMYTGIERMRDSYGLSIKDFEEVEIVCQSQNPYILEELSGLVEERLEPADFDDENRKKALKVTNSGFDYPPGNNFYEGRLDLRNQDQVQEYDHWWQTVANNMSL